MKLGVLNSSDASWLHTVATSAPHFVGIGDVVTLCSQRGIGPNKMGSCRPLLDWMNTVPAADCKGGNVGLKSGLPWYNALEKKEVSP